MGNYATLLGKKVYCPPGYWGTVRSGRQYGHGRGGGGGGAGGTTLLFTEEAELGTSIVTAHGGAGDDGTIYDGSGGAVGVIGIMADSVTGITSPAYISVE